MSFSDALTGNSSPQMSLLKSELNQTAALVRDQIQDFGKRIVLFNNNMKGRKLKHKQFTSELQILNQQSIQCRSAIKDLSEFKWSGASEDREKQQIVSTLYKSLENNGQQLQQILDNKAQINPAQPTQAGAHQPTSDSQQQLLLNVQDAERALIEERAEEVRLIEQTMMDVAEISKDCAELVYSQGDMIDSIEIHVSNSEKDTGRAVFELEAAAKHQKSGGKCLWVILMLIIIVVAAVLLILYMAV